MIKIIYKDEKITIKEISDRKIQVEKIVPVYVGEYLAEHIKMKIKVVYVWGYWCYFLSKTSKG